LILKVVICSVISLPEAQNLELLTSFLHIKILRMYWIDLDLA
jgi:hypothetical protein